MRALRLGWSMLLAALPALTACDPRSSATEAAPATRAIDVVWPASLLAQNSPPLVTPTPVARSPMTAAPMSLTDMRPHKRFVDPPLPRELLDDDGLRPLPPRPPQ